MAFVFRKDTFAARGSDLAIQLDGEIVGWPDGGEYVRVLLDPGPHVLAATLVPKGEDSYSWYAEFWPRSTAPSQGGSSFSFDRALLSLPPDLVLKHPAFAEDYKRVVSTAITNAIVKKSTHQGVLARGDDHWVWAEAHNRQELETTLNEIFDSLKKQRSDFYPRVLPSRFKSARRIELKRLAAEAGQSYFLYLRFPRKQPWTEITAEESLEEFGDLRLAGNEKYGPEWQVGEKFLKNVE